MSNEKKYFLNAFRCNGITNNWIENNSQIKKISKSKLINQIILNHIAKSTNKCQPPLY